MIVVFAVFVIYYIWLLALILAWFKLHRGDFKMHDSSLDKFYSIIVPARNEGNNLSQLLDSIRSNNFPEEHYEIIVVDDHSEDHSSLILEQYPEVQHLQLTSQTGKKAALTKGIEAARGEVIITTDADCVVSKNWLYSIANCFERQSAVFVSGLVTLAPLNTVFHKLQAIEFASLVGTGASSIYLRVPGMCNGANLAFLKKAFYEAEGYSGNDNIPTGDDEFLMNKLNHLYPNRIRFNPFEGSFVKTKPLNTFRQFVQQRKRWASKWKYHKTFRNTGLAVFIATFNFVYLYALYLGIIGHHIFWVPVLMKGVLESFFLRHVLKSSRIFVHCIYFAAIQIIYPFYVVYFAVLANLGGYEWKGRRY